MDKDIERVSVVVPTLNRAEPLRRALASIAAQRLPEGIALDVVVVDNSADGSAGWIAQDFPQMRYLSVPQPGVANARNGGVDATSGAYVAFLDDDEEAGPDWIAEHIETLRVSGAQASFGPVRAEPEGAQQAPAPSLLGFFERRLSRGQGEDITATAAHLGTNNSVFVRAACLGPSPFAVTLNETGGEDSLLLQQLVQQGHRFAWAARAAVTEYVPARRLNWAYVTRRRFLSGQIRTFVQHMLTPPRWHRIAWWMLVGGVQGVLWSVLSVCLPDAQRRQQARSKAWGGWGKLFWARRFRPRLYGSGLVS